MTPDLFPPPAGSQPYLVFDTAVARERHPIVNSVVSLRSQTLGSTLEGVTLSEEDRDKSSQQSGGHPKKEATLSSEGENRTA